MSKATRIRSKRHPGVYYRTSTRLHRGKPDRTWWIYYRADGKPRWLRIGRDSEGVSEEYAAQRLEAIVRLVEKPEPPSRVTMAACVAAYEAWARAEGKGVDRELDRWRLHTAPSLAALPVTAITTDMVIRLKSDLMAKLSPQSALHCLAFLRRCVNHALAMETLSCANPFSSRASGRFRMPAPKNGRVRWFTAEEARHILCGLRPSPIVHAMSLASLKTGLRATELMSMQGSGVDTASGRLWFRPKGAAAGDLDSVPLPENLVPVLMPLVRAPGSALFPGRDGGPMRNKVPKVFYRCLQDLGINHGLTCQDHGWATFHCWRHTFASWLAQSGRVTLQELQKLMRHEKIEMTLRYAHLIPDGQADKLRLVSDRLNGSDRLKH